MSVQERRLRGILGVLTRAEAAVAEGEDLARVPLEERVRLVGAP
jgi:hypothetical protein